MKKDAFNYVVSNYWRDPFVVLSAILQTISTVMVRIVTVFFLSKLTVELVEGDIDSAKTYLVYYGITSITALIMANIADLVGLKYENEVYGQMCRNLYRKLTSKDLNYYNSSHTGYLVTAFRHNNDAAINLNKLLRKDIPRIVVSITVPIVVIAWYSLSIATLCLVLAVIQIIYIRWASNKADYYRRASHEIYKKVSGRVADDITNIISFKSSGDEERFTHEVDDMLRVETDTYWKRRWITASLNLPREIIVQAIVVTIFYLAIQTQSTTSETVFLLTILIGYVFQIMRNIRAIPDMISSVDDYVTKIEATLDILDDSNKKVLDNGKEVLSVKSGEIDIKDIHYSYDDEDRKQKVFSGFNLKIEGGQRIGIVGLSGAGKTTLAHVLMRFDNVQEGQILIDGQDISEVTQSSLRKNISYVTQEPLLFHRSIKDNILYGNGKKTEKEMIKAAKAAHAHEFIKDLPSGYDTIVGERGVKLSGGQKQRVVVARAVLKNSPIVLFDEATSALDSESEEIIQKALPEIIGNHTAIIIDHRLSTVAGLDRIIVIEKGKIIEDGTHDQLVKNRSKYYSLWQKQTSGS